MSKLLDKLERISEGGGQPLGFGAAVNRTKILPVLVIGSVPEGNVKLVATALEANIDAILMNIENPKKKEEAFSQLKNTKIDIPWGVALNTMTGEDVIQLVEMGCDFIVFSPTATHAAVLGENKIGKVIRTDSSLNENLARAISRLSIDAVLLGPEGENEYPITVNQLMVYERLAASAGKHILAAVPPNFSIEDIENLWGIGVRGLIVDLAVKSPEQRLSQVKEAIEKLPLKRRRSEGKISASLPFFGESSAAVPPEEEEDDDD
jgi:DNA-binding NarL/FixJ family response regulator